MDMSLNDDMVKLVRFTIVNIERDKEKILARDEEVVTDALSDDAFASWMISKHVKPYDGKGDDDPRKYLRVSYEVLKRWPKQDRKYEERQLRVLGQIRDALDRKPMQPSRDAFAAVGERLDANALRLKHVRRGFQLTSKKLAAGVAAAFERSRELGEWKAIEVAPEQLEKAFRQGAHVDFSPDGLESFPGRWKGVNRHYDAQGHEIEADAATWHMTWEPGALKDGVYLQNVVGSKEQHFTSAALPPLGERRVDLALNIYRPDLGVGGWLSMWVESRSELALISYQLDPNTFLWIGQVLNEKLEPEMDEKLHWMFLEWIDKGGGRQRSKPHYYMYGLLFAIDFDKGEAVADPQLGFRKARFDRLG